MRASPFLSLVLAFSLQADGWLQWGRTPVHDGSVPVNAQRLERIEGEMVLDPFADQEKQASGFGVLLVHYPVPIVAGNDIYVVVKSGTFTPSWDSQVWNIQNVRLAGGRLETRWSAWTDWKPVPQGGPRWEPVYHPILAGDAIWAPGAGGTMLKLNRETGAVITRFNPFGAAIDSTIWAVGPPAADSVGNIYYSAIQLAAADVWRADPLGSWLIRIAPDGTITRASYASLTPNAPAPDQQCADSFPNTQLPWPPSPNAVAPTVRCGVQRPAINAAPAIAPDGTVYLVSRAHGTDRTSYLIAANRDLTPKWATSLRNRMNDGCDVLIPRSGTPGGCRAGATRGVDPSDNQPGSGRVTDDSTSSPVVAPDGKILYGAVTRYNWSQGHLMMFNPDGSFSGAYQFGWDTTPAIYKHDGTYSILLKENRYGAGSYCNNQTHCPAPRTLATPDNPEQYLLTQLSPSLQVEWQFRNTNTQSCMRNDDGTLSCVTDRPNGFEWCVNAIAVDRRGVVYANSEDGHVYAIGQGGVLRERMFLHLSLGAAYTPLSIGDDGRIYTQNDGILFVIGQELGLRRRAVRK